MNKIEKDDGSGQGVASFCRIKKGYIKMEIWKSLEGIVKFGEYYEVSDKGRVRSLDRSVVQKNKNTVYKRELKGKIMSPIYDKDGYVTVQFKAYGEHKTYKIHRLTALAFIDNPGNKAEVNHIDGVKDNNNVKNLEWVTRRENLLHAVEMRKLAS